MNAKLKETIACLDLNTLNQDRKEMLDNIVEYAVASLSEYAKFKLVFVCTHNSRRSQLAQAWAFCMSKFYQVPFDSYSGGVEVTAFHPNAIEALRNQGFIINIASGTNPKVFVKVDKEGELLTCFSKLYDHESNPDAHFAAVMVCDHADANCPFVPGAEKRISLNYTDPKRFDASDKAVSGYETTSMEIANEMNYIFSKLSKK